LSLKMSYILAIIVVSSVVLGTVGVHASENTGFGFNASDISGISGSVRLTGGGSFSLPDFIHSGGGFRCVETVNKGPFALSNHGEAGCQAGEGVRWDAKELLSSTQFKCFGADTPNTATTGDQTVVMKSDFYKASNGVNESFSDVPMIVSAVDLRPDLDGSQNVWIAGVGCGSALVHFS
jgi:hypothetical protein